ncbi:MAG: hypothetical protein RL664_882 [Bacteroidota bacterium]
MEKEELCDLNLKIKNQDRISLKALEDAKRLIEEVEINMDERQRENVRVVKNLLGSNMRNVGTWPI